MAAALTMIVAGTYTFHVLSNFERETTISTIQRFADLNDVGFVDSYLPAIVDRLHSKGMSYAEINKNLLAGIAIKDKPAKLAGLLAMILAVQDDVK